MKHLILSAIFVLVISATQAQTKKNDLSDLDKVEIKEPGDSAKLKVSEKVPLLDRSITEEKNDKFVRPATNEVRPTVSEIAPSFPGGIEKFFKYLAHNEKYPETARKNNVQGKVYITFVIEKDGSLTDIKIMRSLSAETDAEAIRLIKDCPKWNPGIQNGNPVRVQYTLPVPFPINN